MPNDRCVHCGRPKDRHIGDTLHCPSGSTSYASMALPPGYTCRECNNFLRFCAPIIGLKGTETTCDYWPVRFVLIVPLKAKGAGGA